jgi:CheY-like chemotaxis protein
MKAMKLVTAYDGSQVLTKALNELPDLILVDVMMPEVYRYRSM